MTKTLADWTTERPIRAAPPRPGTEGGRAAYLDLLKLALCDLAGAVTISVGRLDDAGSLFARELEGEQLLVRTNGMDWPLSGLTMAGLLRLDNLQSCIESVIADEVAGDVVEAGTWRGGAAILMRATLDSLGAGGRTVYVADSFQGLPPPSERFPEDDLDLSAIGFLSVPLEEVRAHFARFGLERGVELVPGFFEETLATLGPERSWSVVRLDGDTYESTWLGLEAFYPSLSVGGYLILDDYGAVAGCRQAVEEFRAANGIEEPLVEVDFTCRYWRRESDAPVSAGERGAAPAPVTGTQAPDPPTAPGAGPIEHLREIELRGEIDALRPRLAQVEADLARLRGNPLSKLRWRLAARARRGDER